MHKKHEDGDFNVETTASNRIMNVPDLTNDITIGKWTNAIIYGRPNPIICSTAANEIKKKKKYNNKTYSAAVPDGQTDGWIHPITSLGRFTDRSSCPLTRRKKRRKKKRKKKRRSYRKIWVVLRYYNNVVDYTKPPHRPTTTADNLFTRTPHRFVSVLNQFFFSRLQHAENIYNKANNQTNRYFEKNWLVIFL